jgi:hypothetical protein
MMDDLSRCFYSSPCSIIHRREDEELPRPPSPESTLITIHRCQVCNKEQQQQQQQQGNTTFCFQCQDDDEVAQVTENNTIPVSQSVYLRCYSIIQNLFLSFFLSAHSNKKILISYTHGI